MSDSIFGYSWEAIQRAQRGGRLQDRIDTSKPIAHDVTDSDRALLAKHGSIQALKDAGFYGSADKLERESNGAQ